MAKDGKKFEEDLKRKELLEKRKRLEERRKEVVEEAEALKAQENFIQASRLFEEAAQLSKELAEKDRMRTFRAMAKQMQDAELERRENAKLSEIRKTVEIERRKVLARAEAEKKEGRFRDAAKTYEEAAKLSEQMKEEDRAKEFLAMAKEIRDKEVELLKQWEKDKERNLAESKQMKVLMQAEDAIDQDNYQLAAQLYEEAAKLSRDLGQKDRAQIFLNRAREIRDIERDLKKRIAEEEKRRELEKKRRMLEDERSQAIEKAEKSMETGKFKEAAKFYEIAGEASSELGEKDIAQEFKATAKKIMETMEELKREFREKQKKAPLERRRKILVAKAKQSIDQEKFLEAARLFKMAAIISGEMGEDAKVKELIAKVKESMKREKGRKEEIIDRIMRAFKAIVTLRSMEPEVAVSLYEWTGGEEKYIVIYVWDVGSITLKIFKGEAQITTGEVKKWNVRVEGTANSLMAVAQGKLSATWAWLTGRLSVRGSSGDTSQFMNLMVIPRLEREKDELDKKSSMMGAITILFTAFFVTYLPIWPDPTDLFRVEPLINAYSWGQTLSNWFVKPIPFIGPYLAAWVHPWVWANILLFPMIYIVMSSAMNLLTIQLQRRREAKEKLRIRRRRAMEQAEGESKRGRLRAAIRLFEEAVKLALRAGEDEIAKELSAKISEIIKMLPKQKGKKGKKGKGKGKKRGQTQTQFEAERKESAKEALRFQKEMEDLVASAERAMEEQDFLSAAKFYAKAAEVARKVGDKAKVQGFSAQAEELKKIAQDLGKA
ncbi:MAG: SCP2 sterol-binding domain-containing protein [Promethearchaeota archaeon]